MTPLSEQELHNLAMNIAGEKLQEMGYEFVADGMLVLDLRMPRV